MNVLKLRHEGFTIAEIADELGYHPATISRWIEKGGPPMARETDRSELLIDEHWERRIEMLLEANPRLLATSVFSIISIEGFDGSYPTVSRYVRSLRGPRFSRAERASVPIVTAPGEECLCRKPHRHSSPGGCAISTVSRPLTPAHASQCGRNFARRTWRAKLG